MVWDHAVLVQIQAGRPSFNSSIAQSVEQRTVNPCVPGSSPGRGAKQSRDVEKVSARSHKPKFQVRLLVPQPNNGSEIVQLLNTPYKEDDYVDVQTL